MKICIDPGHGGKDPGAVNGKYYEKDAALDIALKLGKVLSLAGANVIYTRKTDVSGELELKERTDYANAAKADYFVSVHLNSAAAKSAKGIETFAYSKAGTSYKLATAVQKALIAATGAVDRGAKTANYHVLRESNMPAILIETGFISNDQECGKLFTEEYQNIIANAAAKAIAEFTGLELGEEEMVKRYNYLMEIPAGEFRDTVKKLMDKGIIKNKDGQLDLSYDMVRLFVMHNRAGLYK